MPFLWASPSPVGPAGATQPFDLDLRPADQPERAEGFVRVHRPAEGTGLSRQLALATTSDNRSIRLGLLVGGVADSGQNGSRFSGSDGSHLIRRGRSRFSRSFFLGIRSVRTRSGVATRAAELDTGPVASSYPRRIPTRLSTNDFQFACATFCSASLNT